MEAICIIKVGFDTYWHTIQAQTGHNIQDCFGILKKTSFVFCFSP